MKPVGPCLEKRVASGPDKHSYVFGPIPSRRLGRSLGVDLIPPKTCTFDCLYCQVGRTTCKSVDPISHVIPETVLPQIKARLRETFPDAVTLAGSGEPTLHPQVGRIIHEIRRFSSVRVALLTNGSLFWKEAVLEGALEAHIIMPTLTTAFQTTFERIHRPHPSLTLEMAVKGLMRLREVYRGEYALEVMLLAGMNDSEEELNALRLLIGRLSPDKIQLNTVARPPADLTAAALDRSRLQKIKDFFGDPAEIVAEPAAGGSSFIVEDWETRFLDAIRRRPLRVEDVSRAWGLSRDSVQSVLQALAGKGLIRAKSHFGEVYYSSHERESD
jgi:wyosine [tRNA(Phe)-imidazoG37] synthetase (radical SAM superfamily)